MLRLFIVIAIPFLSFVYTAPQAPFVFKDDAPKVRLGGTTLVGTKFVPDNVECFSGIPFAEPPTGPLRFQPPVLKHGLNVTQFDSSHPGFACLQIGLPTHFASEDCLTINIFRPSGQKNGSLPVMAWIHGGGFNSGSASWYNGSSLVTQSVARSTPIIYVNFNYRLGPLGFPTGLEAAGRDTTNLGLKDQLTALEWIQTNIEAFGGDKTKVTISGQSAGATAIDILLFSNKLNNLARGAILESIAAVPIFDPQVDNGLWENFVSAVPECASVAKSNNTFKCLQNVPSSSILKAMSTQIYPEHRVGYWPVIDGPDGLIPDIPSRLPVQAKIPTIIGSNLDEGTFMTPRDINSSAAMRTAILGLCSPSPRGATALSTAVDRLLELYPNEVALGSPFGTGNNTFGLAPEYKQFAAINGDFVFTSRRRALIQTMSQISKTFGYIFQDADATLHPTTVRSGPLGITHAAELPYIYNHVLNPTPEALALSLHMRDYWISFVATLDPNDNRGNKRIHWPQYTSDSKILIQLDGSNTTLIQDDYRVEQIAFINSDPLVFGR